LKELKGAVFGDRSMDDMRWIETRAVERWQSSIQQLLDSWTEVEELLFWEVLEQWRFHVLNRRSLPDQVKGTPDRPGVSLVLLECEGMPSCDCF
jgi:hypothetical protein